MQHFEANGLWFPGDDPKNAVGGILRYDSNGLNLNLLGAFRQGWTAGDDRYPLIRGVVGKSPYGTYVTLFDGFMTSRKINMANVTSEKIHCQLAAIGNLYLPEEPFRLAALHLEYSYLAEWVGKGGIEVEHQWSGEIPIFVSRYKKPKNHSFPYGIGTLTLGFNFTSSQRTHGSTFNEDAVLVVEPVGEITQEKLVPECIRMLQDLVSFATDTPNSVEKATFRGEPDQHGLRAELSVVYEPIFDLREKKENIHSNDMLFTFEDCQVVSLDIFQRWHDFSQKYRAFCEVYFGYTYARPKYTDDRLTKMMSAFSLLCSDLLPRSDRTANFMADVRNALSVHYSEQERLYLAPLLPTGVEVEAPILLLGFLRDYSDIMGEVIEDIPSFVRTVVDTIDSFGRRSNNGKAVFGGGDLYYAVEKIKTLIKIIVLTELGFDRASVNSFLERNKHFVHLKTV